MIELNVNGQSVQVDAEPGMPLLWVLRDLLNLTGTKYGCGISACGACTVMVNGHAVRSCVFTVGKAEGKRIRTIDGTPDRLLRALQAAWIAEQVPQCGYCQNGQILTAKALLDRNPNPTDAEIREGMEGALCRCMTYYRIQAAIKRVVRGAPENEEAAV